MNFSTLRANNRIYLDHNATTPLAERVRERVPGWLELWGNPSSIHHSGRGPKTVMRESRDHVARMLGANPLEVIFTSGGSESNNLAIKGVFESFQKAELFGRERRNHYLISAVEHPSVMRTAEYLQERGAQVEYIPILRSGALDLEAYENLLSERTALVSVMYANNETGNVFPIRRLVELAHAKGALFHSDCVQALGKAELNLSELGVDLASFSGHKFYALKGSGVLYARRGIQIESLIHGGGQERHRRGGTENLLAAASLGAMCELKSLVAPKALEVGQMRDLLERRVLQEIEGVALTGAESPRLPNTSSMVIEGIDGETLLMNLDMRGFSVSTGAACSSGSPEPSPVLLAMGLTRAEAQSSLRVGLGWGTTAEEVEKFVETLKSVVAHLRTFVTAKEVL
jgi:cysteine desulfurase